MKNIIVQKFGGTSVADISCIENVANLVSKEKDKGSNVVVVVSAMSGITDELIKKVNQVFCDDSESARKEYDVAIASGEQVSAALLALMLQKKGYNIARRTVAKYREQLNIPVARLRKEL